ncbi:hypothetical protein [Salirhabdus salicampi]|uniref:hypothetical protein n=1 Tax=Salirhabdus salicampi TaxID=476102 RepID=UPI0020C4ACDC|nr:hypothetical protein [Salirhabdus salicampi]MCP8615803.1 hypothetical protein [Salirhabdus salicampi]
MKKLSFLLIIIGLVSTIIGFIPVFFIYPYKEWQTMYHFFYYIFLHAPDRLYWQIGLVVLCLGVVSYRNNSPIE